MGKNKRARIRDDPTKARILSAALSLFAEKGYEGARVQDLARAVGVKAASLYAHFPGKEAVFRAVFDAALASWRGVTVDSFAAAAGAPGLEEGVFGILSRYTHYATQGDTFRFWARMYIFPPPVLGKKDFAAFKAFDDEYAERLARYCMERLPAELRGRRAEPLVSSLVRLTWGFIMCGAPEDTGAMRKEMRAVIRLLMNGLKGEER